MSREIIRDDDGRAAGSAGENGLFGFAPDIAGYACGGPKKVALPGVEFKLAKAYVNQDNMTVELRPHYEDISGQLLLQPTV